MGSWTTEKWRNLTGIDRIADLSASGKTPVSDMQTFWGLMRAYWLSERWKEAWLLTSMIIFLTAAVSKASVWMAVSSGELLSALVNIHEPMNLNPMGSVLWSGGALIMIVLVKDAGLVGLRHLLSTTLHRKWRGWLNERFNRALLDGNHTHYHLQQAGGDASADENAAPDNIDQRLQESIKGMTGGAIGLAMGILGVTMSVLFVGQKLLEISTEVRGFEFLGSYGSAAFAFVAIGVYVPLNTYIAMRIGRVLEKLTLLIQQTEGSYRGELTTFLRRSFHVAASGGADVQRAVNLQLYSDIDATWDRLNKVDAGYMSFTAVYNFLATRIVAYLPGLLPYMNHTVNLKSYVTGAELVGSMINECSWFIHVMPAIANLKANSRRVTELAEAVERVQTPVEFYRSSGVNEFTRTTQHAFFGLTLRNIELMHQGKTAVPFLTAAHIRFRRGEWTYLKGVAGCGKTSLLKAMNGLWAHGRGSIILPENVSTMYAAQEVKLPHVSLKQLVCLPETDNAFSEDQIAAALYRADMGAILAFLDQDSKDGTSWDQLLSGGQKQKLVLARILLHRPGILFLDEATGALDPLSKIAFHQAIQDHCPGITVLSVMHEATPPTSASGAPFYSSILEIRDCVARKFVNHSAIPPSIANGLPGFAAKQTLLAAE